MLPHNNHNVYILGAGFSASAGLPVMRNFLNRMRDALEWTQTTGREIESRAIDAVLNYRLSAASAAYWATLDLENVEQLFSLASAALDPVREELPVAIAATLEYARSLGDDRKVQVSFEEHESEQRYRLKSRTPSGLDAETPSVIRIIDTVEREGRLTFSVAALLGMFNSQSVPTGHNTFITFNYDTLLESALTTLQVPWTYGFEWNQVNFRVSGASDWGRSKMPEAIPVLKLHGSVNWGYPEKERLTVFESYESLREGGGKPRLIPPTWSKVVDDQISSTWKLAIDRLSMATRIIVIGFSMPETDLHFRYLLAAGLQRNAWLRAMDFVNTDTTALEKNVRAILKPGYIDQHLIRFTRTRAETFAAALATNRPTFYATSTADVDGLASSANCPIDIGRAAQREFACRISSH